MTVFNDHEMFSDERICDRCSSKDKKIGISDAELSEDSTLVEEAADSFEETLKIKESQE